MRRPSVSVPTMDVLSSEAAEYFAGAIIPRASLGASLIGMSFRTWTPGKNMSLIQSLDFERGVGKSISEELAGSEPLPDEGWDVRRQTSRGGHGTMRFSRGSPCHARLAGSLPAYSEKGDGGN